MIDSSSPRHLARLAIRIHHQLSETQKSFPEWHLPDYTWQCAQREHRRLRIAVQKRWRHAQAAQHERLKQALHTLQDELQAAVNGVQQPAMVAVASPREILSDLMALPAEFDQVSYEPRHALLSATTGPVTVEGLYLGPFRIELDLRTLTPHPSYLVVAEEPQRPERNSEVTHPHVEGERLCEGEGTMAIRAAVRSGRLLDFFLIVRNLLHTYNAASPYVSIGDWDGASCSECDYSMDGEDARSCERCEATLCSECSRCCGDCSETLCTNCSRVCHGCDEDLCRGCAKACCDCHQEFCSSCLENDERCHVCHEENQEQRATDVASASL